LALDVLPFTLVIGYLLIEINHPAAYGRGICLKMLGAYYSRCLRRGIEPL